MAVVVAGIKDAAATDGGCGGVTAAAADDDDESFLFLTFLHSKYIE